MENKHTPEEVINTCKQLFGMSLLQFAGVQGSARDHFILQGLLHKNLMTGLQGSEVGYS